MKSMFAQFSISEIVVSDNSPQYSPQGCAGFAKAYHFSHTTSSPYYPQSNGQAECTVEAVKELLTDSSDPYLALLSNRATPLL